MGSSKAKLENQLKSKSNVSNKLERPTPQSNRTPQIIKSGHGGKREGSGRPQRKPAPWPKDLDLKAGVDVDRFLCLTIQRLWSENVLDARALSALNGTVRLLLDHRKWLGPDLEVWNDPVSYEVEEDQEDAKKQDADDQFEPLVTVSDEIQRMIKQKAKDEVQEIAANTQAILDDPTVPENIKEKARKVLDMTQKSKM